MRGLTALAALLGLSSPPLLDQGNKSGFTIARAGKADQIVITKQNTLNGTTYHHMDGLKSPNRFVVVKPMTLEFINRSSGGNLKAYVLGLDSSGKVVFVKSDGTLYYPTSWGSSIPVEVDNKIIAIDLPGRGEKFKLDLSVSLASGRVYFSEGELDFFMVKTPDGDGIVQPSAANPEDPSSETNWGFVEFTYTPQGVVYASISYVDFVGMILSMSLKVDNGPETQVTNGLTSGAVSTICNELSSPDLNGRNWNALCVVDRAGRPIRVLSPNLYAVINPNDFEDYWQVYVDQVWEAFSIMPLTIDTQAWAGKVECRVYEKWMICDGDNRWYEKPSAKDIWGCNSGTFGKQADDNDVHLAVIARLCAAFNRSTLLLAGGDVQPRLQAASYYQTDPTNHYSRLVHQHEVDGKGYAFSYDDVNPDGENASGLLSGQAETLTVYVG